MTDRGLWIAHRDDRADLAGFVAAALRIDAAAVIRLRARPDGRVAAWAGTGLDVLATRAVRARLQPGDVTAAAATLAAGLRDDPGVGPGDAVDLGYPMESAWRGALPPERGFRPIDDIPARMVIELADRGAGVVRGLPGGPGPPTALLNQHVLSVTGPGGAADIPLRVVFALVAMRFLPQAAEGVDPAERVRVRVTDAWLRLDARYGAVTRRRDGGLPLLIG
ncbi:hypothetical protein [Skermania piniformis]|uniref:Uncharacterized protein n=1 Tax=Skermania pinensis TaxID=39122 RepID=A0ABX8SAJ9_9ACTN|nr:hypothetical protein [Skermania piniformis]QXQ14889.1 hypothetical protein KV203_05770 [Skermania piniformis]